MNKKEMTAVIDRYAVVNAGKNAMAKEAKELGLAIKAYFTAKGIAIFNTEDNVAIINYKTSRELDAKKIAAHFGGTIPDEYYTVKQTPTLTVKTRVAAKAVEKAISAA